MSSVAVGTLDAREEPFEWTPQPAVSAEVHLARLTGWLEATGRNLLYVNLTPPDMAELGLYTARAILPGGKQIDWPMQTKAKPSMATGQTGESHWVTSPRPMKTMRSVRYVRA